MLPEWTSKLKFLFIGKSRRDVDDEIQFHIERQIEANLAEGMSIDEARLQANITFGGRQRTRARRAGAVVPAWASLGGRLATGRCQQCQLL